jgi:hypothetical protein
MEQADTQNYRQITQEDLVKNFTYNPSTGEFNRLRGRAKTGSVNNEGYVHIKINNKIYKAHRLAFLYMTGDFPADEVDHINGNRSDNRWENLRKCTRHQNMGNSKTYQNNRSNLKGVRKNRNGWEARIRINGTAIQIGTFKTREEAKAAYDAKAVELFKEFARLV